MDCRQVAGISFIACLFSSVTVIPHVHGEPTYENETLLLNTLQSSYKKNVRPSTPTDVYLFYSLRTLQSLDITEQSMSTTGWLSLFWHDPRLVWTATDYSNITQMDADWVWRPEFMIANMVEGLFFGGYDNDKVRFRVFSTGMVRWIMPLPLTTTCDVDIAKFPFDSQSCHIDIVFWGFNTIDLAPNITTEQFTDCAVEKLVVVETPMEKQANGSFETMVNSFAYLENAEWQYNKGYVTTEIFPMCCPESIAITININLSFTRLRPFYVINLIVPAMLFSACMVLTFLLPTECGERLGYSLTILLSYTVLMTITSSMMPTTSKQTPHINTYLLILLILCSMSVLNVVVSVKMFYLKSKPPKLLQIIGRKLDHFCFFKFCKAKDKVGPAEYSISEKVEEKSNMPYRKERLKSDDDSNKDKDEPEEFTWQQLAALQDRMCFYVYAITCLILILVFVLSLLGYV